MRPGTHWRQRRAFVIICTGKGSTERSMQKSQSSKVSIKANCLGSKAIGKSQCIENQFSKGLIYTQLSDKSWTHSRKVGHCRFTSKVWTEGTDTGGQAREGHGAEDREQGWEIGDKPERDSTVLIGEKPPFPDRAKQAKRKYPQRIHELVIWPINHSAKGSHLAGLGVLQGCPLQYSRQQRIMSLTTPPLCPTSLTLVNRSLPTTLALWKWLSSFLSGIISFPFLLILYSARWGYPLLPYNLYILTPTPLLIPCTWSDLSIFLDD